MKQLTIPEVARLLLEGDNYLILTHRRPDGDTIGCAAALCGGLRAMGKRAAILDNPQFTKKYAPFLEGLTVAQPPVDATVIATDVASANILSFSAQDYADRVDLRIDHHGTDLTFGKQGYVDPSTAACGEIILDLLKEMKAPISKCMAEALYCAISTDTGCFRYSNVTSATLRAAADCKDYGADTFTINRVMFGTKGLNRLKLEAYLTESTRFYAGGLVAVSAIPDTVKENLRLTEDDIDDISGFGRDIAGVEIAVMLREVQEGSKISLRTSPNYDAAAICKTLGGGGHRAAAGATVKANLEDTAAAILRAIRESGVDC